ncbi:MAG: hypothetical protein RR851_10225 [Clostridium sp.]
MIQILELFGGVGAPRKALINLGVEVKVWTKFIMTSTIRCILSDNPNTIVLEPCEYEFDRELTLDKNLTAKAIFNVIKEQGRSLSVTIINRSELIGNPLYTMLRDADYTPIQCHSKTSKESLSLSLCADLIVTATGDDMSEVFRYKSKHEIIDVSNDIRKYDIEYRLADQTEIGKRTLDLLFASLKVV